MVGLKANTSGVYSNDEINSYNTTYAAALTTRIVLAVVDTEGKFKLI